MIQIQTKGFKELDDELKKLPLKLQKQMMSSVVREGAKVVQKEAKRLAPVRAKEWEGMNYGHPKGTLKRGIIVRKITKGVKGFDKNLTQFAVTFSKKAFYGMWVELGHMLVRIKGNTEKTYKWSSAYDTSGRTKTRRGEIIGFVAPRPFLRPAFDKNQNNIINAMRDKFAKLLEGYKRG